jgi:hypothetical protein
VATQLVPVSLVAGQIGLVESRWGVTPLLLSGSHSLRVVSEPGARDRVSRFSLKVSDFRLNSSK